MRVQSSKDLERFKFPPDPAGLLERLGVQKVRVRGGKLTAICPLHSGADNEEGFYGFIDPSRGQHPGTYGCGSKKCWKGDLIELVQQLLPTDFKGAINWIGAMSGYADLSELLDAPFKPVRRVHAVEASRVRSAIAPDKVTPEIIQAAERLYWATPEGYWSTRLRPFSDEIIRLYEGGLVRRREGHKDFGFKDVSRAIFPIYASSGELAGWTGRATDDAIVNMGKPEPGRPRIPKWRHWPGPTYGQDGETIIAPGIETGDHFFGWKQAEWCLLEAPRAILAEGPGDTVSGAEMACELGEPWFPLGILGASLKPRQAEILRENGVVEVWCVQDGDEAGQAMIRSVRELMPFATIWGIRPPERIKDLGEVQDPRIYRAMVQARELV